MSRNRCTDSIISGKECSICKGMEKVGKFNKKKRQKTPRVFAKITRDGKWHVAVDDSIAKDWKTLFFPCQHYGMFGGKNEIPKKSIFGISRGPFHGYIFTKPHKICGTCMRMSRNKEFLKEAGFI